MSLLREIQGELSQSGVDVVAVLRKCKILAARLGSPEFSQWVDWELSGYPESEPIPEYRKLSVTHYASFMNVAWKIAKASVPLYIVPEEFRDSFEYIEFRGGIAKAASIAQSKGVVGRQVPELILLLQGKMYPGMSCQGVWTETATTEFEQLVSAVTSRILDFSLKLEAENPLAGEALPNSEPVSREKLRPLVQNTFYGNIGAFAQNSEHFNQSTTFGIPAQDLQQFVTEFSSRLSELGLDPRQKQRAEAQLAALKLESTSAPDTAIVRQAARTLRNITEGAIGSLLAAAVQPATWHWIQETLRALST